MIDRLVDRRPGALSQNPGPVPAALAGAARAPALLVVWLLTGGRPKASNQ